MLAPLDYELFPDPNLGHQGLYGTHESVVGAFGQHVERTESGAVLAVRFSGFLEDQREWLDEVNDLSLGDSLAQTTQALRDRIIANPREVSPFKQFPDAISGGIDDANGYFVGWMSALRYAAQHPVGKQAVAHINPEQFSSYNIPAIGSPEWSSRTLIHQITAIRYNALTLPSYVTDDIRQPRLEAVQVGMSAGLLAVEYSATENG